ncbi:hypothetical protein BZB76_3359 [Actinomadura pelletieri DSM 43383]|uniref:Uncharacterized protein n=1 Tax=Actinomadura pelletieri DSM 43383 TaxID=1120940 RepID=A0A495QPG7_9ACTN|nr:hypothetical protein [Actinomadura pelletieri]RKS74837.1 hypothetical protein BZB76_3359 [Actinomadura pelletieri DSM 43383]
MTGDLGSDAGRARARPSFLPPVDGYPPPAGDTAPVAPLVTPPGRGAPWIAAMIVAASALLVSAFMPWARAEIVVELFGRPIGRDLGSVAGIDADDLVLAVPVLGVVAIALACGDLAGRDPRIGGLAAIPGTLALLVCGLFVLRLGDVRDDLPRTGLDVGYQITVRYGWYLAVIASLMVIGFSLARPISERVSRTRPRPEQPHAQYHAGRQYYTGRQYYAERPPADDPGQGQS